RGTVTWLLPSLPSSKPGQQPAFRPANEPLSAIPDLPAREDFKNLPDSFRAFRFSTVWGLLKTAAAIGMSFVSPIVAGGIYIAVALMWLIPGRRLLRVV